MVGHALVQIVPIVAFCDLFLALVAIVMCACHSHLWSKDRIPLGIKGVKTAR